MLSILALILISSCNPMKKDVMKDTADDVNSIILSESKDGKFLVMNEEVFQATSKSDDRGIRQITGYTEYRISSYDLNTGTLSRRIALGDAKDNSCIFLGETDGKLWYKSVDKQFGFHARDPKTLDVVVSEAQLTDANPVLKNNLSRPEWNNIIRYYGFDAVRNSPMIADNQGFVYIVDPVTLKAEKISESITNLDFDNRCTSSSINLDVNKSVNLLGSPRSFITYEGREVKEPSFLKGEFLVSSNSTNPLKSNSGFILPIEKEIEIQKHTIDSIKEFIANADTISGDKWERRKNVNNLKYAQRNIEYALENIEREEDKIKREVMDDYFEIITAGNCSFVLSQTDATDQAKVIISKIKFNGDSTITLVWQTELQNIFRDPVKGLDRSSFEIVFSKGSPDLNTMRAIADDKKLIFVFMLKAVCLDIESGKILWQFDV